MRCSMYHLIIVCRANIIVVSGDVFTVFMTIACGINASENTKSQDKLTLHEALHARQADQP